MKKGIMFTKWNHLFDKEKILSLNRAGLNSTRIAKKVGIPHQRFREMLIHHEITLQGKFQILAKNDYFFDIIDNEIKAYLLGYLIADGCISVEPKIRDGKVYSHNKRIIFSSSIDDKQVMDLYINYICPNNKYSIIHNAKGAKKRKLQINLKFSSKELVDTLIRKYGILPRKTHDINFEFPFEKIPISFRRHFIRGFFDGDGTVVKHYRLPSISFTGTSLNFFKQIEQELTNYDKNFAFYYLTNILGKTVNYHKLYVKGKNLYTYLYKNSKFYLTRKEKVLKEISITKNEKNILGNRY